MNRKHLLFVALLLTLSLALAACGPPATPEPTEAPPPEPTEAPPPEPTAVPELVGPQEFAEMPIVTTASSVIGVGTYAAGQAFALEGEEEITAIILPYGIYPDMEIEDIAEFEGPESAAEGFTFDWALEVPEGSSASLTVSGGVAVWLADVAGDYALTLTATDAEGLSATTTWTIHAANYVGMGGIAGEPEKGQCAACHAGKVAEWAETGHASMLIRGLDGTLSSHYGPNCVRCHSTGFNNRPEAVNGGFDDLATASTWLFPKELKEGNWDAMVNGFPELASLGNIQCESCHGPGSDHYTADVSHVGPISVSLAYGNCAQCHAEQTHHVYPLQWELSGHADKAAMAFTYPIGEGHEACARCHSGEGYIDNAAGKEALRTGYQIITCAVCHDPHDASNPHQLRVYDTASPLPDGTQISGAGPAATCMSCHNSRQDASQVESEETPHWPHYSTAAELLNNTGGYTWGESVDNSPHSAMVQETCVGCHMADTPGMDDMGTPDDSSDDQPLPGHNTVGAHTFAMVSPVDGTENLAVCQACHGDVESFAFTAKDDYDGDGVAESNQDEIQGLRQALKAALEARGVDFLDSYPYFALPENASVDVKGGVWNYKFTGSGGSAVHNFKRTLGLLQLSLKKLGVGQ